MTTKESGISIDKNVNKAGDDVCVLSASGCVCLLSNSCDAEDDFCLIRLAPGSFDAKDIVCVLSGPQFC